MRQQVKGLKDMNIMLEKFHLKVCSFFEQMDGQAPNTRNMIALFIFTSCNGFL